MMRSVPRITWIANAGGIALLVGLLTGCSSSPESGSPSDGKSPKHSTVDVPVGPAVPEGSKLLTEGIEEERYSNNAVRIRRFVRRYEGDIAINHGDYREYYNNGRPSSSGKFDMGRRVGDWNFWYSNGQLVRSEHYHNGKLDGAWAEFRDDGTKRGEVSYRDGIRTGLWVNYANDGQAKISEGEYEDGVFHGKVRDYYPSGQVKSEKIYVHGKLDGICTNWDDKGKKRRTISYRDDVKDGLEQDYDDNGRVVFSREYVKGKPK